MDIYKLCIRQDFYLVWKIKVEKHFSMQAQLPTLYYCLVYIRGDVGNGQSNLKEGFSLFRFIFDQLFQGCYKF